MKRFLLRRPSPALIVAIIALVAALGGTAIAGGVLTTKKFNKQAVKGPVVYSTTTVSVGNTSTPSNPGVHVSVGCPAGARVLGGGIKVLDEADMYVNDSYPTTTGWAGTVYNGNASAQSAVVTAICATAKQSSGVPPTS